MFCPNCGKEIQDGSAFCPECGTRIEAAGATERIPTTPTGQAALTQVKSGVSAPMAAVIAVVVVAVVAGVAFGPKLLQLNDGASGMQAAQQDTAATSKLSVQVNGSDASSCPSIVATLSITDGSGEPVTSLTASDLSVSEKGGDGSSVSAIVRDLVSNGGGTYQLIFQSNIPEGSTAPRSVTISPVGADHTWDAVGFTYNPPAQKDDSAQSSDATQTKVVVIQPVVEHLDAADYILPNSDKVYYSRSDFAGLSDWELYVARNEIYARYGREFKNDDLARYFARKSWYVPRYTPEEFDSMASPLNSYEKHNVDELLSYEKSIGSQYI